MPTTHTDHDAIVAHLREQFAPVLEQSPDGVYLWVDERNKVCNERLASMFGYTVEQWESAEPFLETFVAESDRATYGGNYRRFVGGLERPASFRFTARRKDGSTFAAETDMIPISFAGHPVAYHFVRTV